MEIIAQEASKGKSWLGRVPDGALTAAVVILASGASFGLGMLTERELGQGGGPIRIEGIPAGALPAAASAALPSGHASVSGAAHIETPAAPKAIAPTAKTSGTYVASKNGTKFYLPTCSTAKRIKEENKIWFDTEDEARAAGFEPGANCPGL